MKKRLIHVILLLLVSALLLTSCNSTTDGGTTTDQTYERSSDSDKKDSESQSPKKREEPEESEKPEESEEPETPAETKNNSDKFARGVWNDSTYTSEYASVTFEMPEGWLYGNDEELANLMNVGADLMAEGGTSFPKEIMGLKVIYDMMAQNPITGSSVMLMYENLAMTIGGSQIMEDDYLEITKQQMLALSGDYAYIVDDNFRTETLCGEEFRVMDLEMENYPVYQSIYVRRIDSYILGVSITKTGDADISEILDCFS